jgi:trimethylamine--corrinoid protein Co-methyltransferase
LTDLNAAARVGSMRFLSDADKRDIYEGALWVLSEVGMTLHHEEAVQLLLSAGCRVDDGGRVRVPKRLVEDARGSVPSMIRVYDREGALAMELGHYNSYFGPGSDLLSTYDVETGEHRPSSLEDVARAAHLVDALSNIDFVMSSAYPAEIEPHASYLRSYAAMMRNTTKPLVVTAEDAKDLRVMCDVAAVLRGGDGNLRDRPYFIVYNEPVSPLSHSVEGIEKLLVCADTGVPSIYASAQIMGATAPVTVAGHMVQGIAECLFGMVLHQLRSPGAPFVFGHGLAVLDMSTSQCLYNSVESYLTEVGMIEMAKWLDLPNFGLAGSTDSQLVDAQNGLEIAELTLLVMQAGSNLNHDVGYMDFGLTGSLESIVITDECVGLNRSLMAGIEVTRESLALDVIATVGPGGSFLGEAHTRKLLRSNRWQPTILNRRSRDRWLLDGGPDLRERARRRALELLKDHDVKPLPADVGDTLDRALARGVVR